ncbi:MAG: ATP-grasp domain-containing protein [Alphaproteobacteria bacterium]|nr:ATP-grasp domain-containing protein [Alphaproteobacteria bacterium]
MIRSVLIANRGEIACRVIRTARRMGIRSVAVYSDADANARHVALADEAFHIGPAPARESYLNVDAILRAAKESGAEAIHPGYGFLSENAGFAAACAKAGVIFIGPPPAAIESMGSKSGAKALMIKAGVPVVPGYHGADQSGALLKREAEKIGFPVLIKATAGGGGRGMRVVEKADAFDAALESAQRESQAAFGDARVLVEKYLLRPRHIEIQVFADRHGNAIHLFERECSIQRRHHRR